MPRATDEQLLGMIRSSRSLGWIKSASGWKTDEVTTFAVRNGFTFGADAHPRPIVEQGGASTPTDDGWLMTLLGQAERSALSSTRKMATRVKILVTDLGRRVESELEQAAAAAAAAKEREDAAAEVRRLEGALAAAREKARGSRPTRPQAAARDGGSDMAEIRAWARQNGFTVGDKGVIRTEIRDAYAKAH